MAVSECSVLMKIVFLETVFDRSSGGAYLLTVSDSGGARLPTVSDSIFHQTCQQEVQNGHLCQTLPGSCQSSALHWQEASCRSWLATKLDVLFCCDSELLELSVSGLVNLLFSKLAGPVAKLLTDDCCSASFVVVRLLCRLRWDVQRQFAAGSVGNDPSCVNCELVGEVGRCRHVEVRRHPRCVVALQTPGPYFDAVRLAQVSTVGHGSERKLSWRHCPPSGSDCMPNCWRDIVHPTEERQRVVVWLLVVL